MSESKTTAQEDDDTTDNCISIKQIDVVCDGARTSDQSALNNRLGSFLERARAIADTAALPLDLGKTIAAYAEHLDSWAIDRYITLESTDPSTSPIYRRPKVLAWLPKNNSVLLQNHQTVGVLHLETLVWTKLSLTLVRLRSKPEACELPNRRFVVIYDFQLFVFDFSDPDPISVIQLQFPFEHMGNVSLGSCAMHVYAAETADDLIAQLFIADHSIIGHFRIPNPLPPRTSASFDAVIRCSAHHSHEPPPYEMDDLQQLSPTKFCMLTPPTSGLLTITIPSETVMSTTKLSQSTHWKYGRVIQLGDHMILCAYDGTVLHIETGQTLSRFPITIDRASFIEVIHSCSQYLILAYGPLLCHPPNFTGACLFQLSLPNFSVRELTPLCPSDSIDDIKEGLVLGVQRIGDNLWTDVGDELWLFKLKLLRWSPAAVSAQSSISRDVDTANRKGLHALQSAPFRTSSQDSSVITPDKRASEIISSFVDQEFYAPSGLVFLLLLPLMLALLLFAVFPFLG